MAKAGVDGDPTLSRRLAEREEEATVLMGEFGLGRWLGRYARTRANNSAPLSQSRIASTTSSIRSASAMSSRISVSRSAVSAPNFPGRETPHYKRPAP